MGKGENLDSPEEIDKVKKLTGTYTESHSDVNPLHPSSSNANS